MHESSIEREGSRREFLEVLGEYDTPAYIQRGFRTEGALRDLMAKCHEKRDSLLEFCQLRVAQLAALIGQDWSIVDEHATISEPIDKTLGNAGSYLKELDEEWQYELRVDVRRSESANAIRRSIKEVASSFESFNKKWERFLEGLDLSEINRIRQDYNDYYVCEKAAALQSERLAAHGFERLQPLALDDIRNRIPSLSVPRLR